MKTIGIFEELQSNGSIARSWMRYACTVLIMAALAYLFRQLIIEHEQMTYLWGLLKEKFINDSTYAIMKADVTHVDWSIFSTLLGSGIGGKLIQKFGEAKPETPAP